MLATAAAQNYGLTTYRIRQPFDFAGRTGTIKLDMDLTQQRPRRLARADPRAGSVARAQLRLAGARLGSAQRRRDRVRHRLVQHAAHAGGDRLHVHRLPADGVRPVVRLRDPARDDGARRAQPRRGLRHPDARRGLDVGHVARRRDLPQPAPAVGRRRRAAVLARLREPRGAQPRDDQVLARLGGGRCAGTTSASTAPSSPAGTSTARPIR